MIEMNCVLEKYDAFFRVFGVFEMRSPTYVIHDPEIIKKIGVKDFDHFPDRRGFLDPEIEPLLGILRPLKV